MIKLIIYLAIIGGLVFLGSTVKLGKRTFFGHVRAIWHTEEVQDLKNGVEDKAGPLIERGKRGLNAALNDDDTTWLAVGMGGLEADVPKCAHAEVIEAAFGFKQQIKITASGSDCPTMNVYVSEPTSDGDISLERWLAGKTVTRKETTSAGWIVESTGPWIMYMHAKIGGHTYTCVANGVPHPSDRPADIAAMRHACESLRAKP